MDFVDLRAGIKGLVEKLDHQFLNDIPPFDRLNPSAENLAKYICDGVEPLARNKGLQVYGVTVWETDTTSATYRPRNSDE
jgi:6-pyruvoyltetrahydropterin/6-carboxytetrahydropterin synthase